MYSIYIYIYILSIYTFTYMVKSYIDSCMDVDMTKSAKSDWRSSQFATRRTWLPDRARRSPETGSFTNVVTPGMRSTKPWRSTWGSARDHKVAAQLGVYDLHYRYIIVTYICIYIYSVEHIYHRYIIMMYSL